VGSRGTGQEREGLSAQDWADLEGSQSYSPGGPSLGAEEVWPLPTSALPSAPHPLRTVCNGLAPVPPGPGWGRAQGEPAAVSWPAGGRVSGTVG
jgi:hypothetical protein